MYCAHSSTFSDHQLYIESTVTTPSDPGNRLVCPNCHAVNAPNTTICISCGIKVEDFRSALPRLEQMKSSSVAMHREQLEDAKRLKIQDSIKDSKRSFRRLLLILVVVLAVGGLAAAFGGILYANRVKQTRAEQDAQYLKSISCFQEQEYGCAKEGFQNLIWLGAEYPQLNEKLNAAQYGLAQQYFESGQWERSVQELNDLLLRDPGNKSGVSLLKDSYDRWLDQLKLERKWLKGWAVRRERDARFPPGED
jgi:tetratricopeptide (TPR) repeat protein